MYQVFLVYRCIYILFSEGEWYELVGQERTAPWRPSVSFLNVLTIKKLPEFGGTTMTSYWIETPHALEYSETMEVTISCDFDFSLFPFDEHTCHLDIGDPKYELDTLRFRNIEVFYKDKGTKRGTSPITILRPRLPFIIHVEAKQSFVHTLVAVDEHFSFTGFKLNLTRTNLGQLLAGYYIPTGLFAALSTLSYSIPSEQVKVIEA